MLCSLTITVISPHCIIGPESRLLGLSVYIQGLPFAFDTMYLALADRNMQVRFFAGDLGILSRGNLTYDPLIWLTLFHMGFLR